ncbi:MAG: O-fucosyltransferase family protein, partial [Candidatus Methylopumilus sp.]|nr:O-fucosyltransferase family protein [Candidatus Methylopumilus sp.]
FVSFDTWWGGFSNIRMSYEMAAAISVISKRKLIIPHKIYCLFFSDWKNKKSFFDIWNLLDKDLFIKNFNCVDYEHVEEYKSLENEIQYFHGVDKIAKLILFTEHYQEWRAPQKAMDKNNFIFCEKEYENDYTKFAKKRSGISINLPDKYIHFPRNLFGYFYYLIYGNGPNERNLIKNKIINGVKYKNYFFEEAKKVKNILKDFNAIHVRRNDFLRVRKKLSEDQMAELKFNLRDKLPNSNPLYIATDEKNKAVFDFLKKDYEIFFLEDFFKDLKNYEAMALDQTICSEAEIFFGSKLSTYTDYINIIRGVNGKQDFHRKGINFNYGNSAYDLYPWENECADWNRLHSFYWKYEKIT